MHLFSPWHPRYNGLPLHGSSVGDGEEDQSVPSTTMDPGSCNTTAWKPMVGGVNRGRNPCNTVCDTMFCTATWSSIWQGNLPESPLIRVIWVHWIQLIPCESLTCNTMNYAHFYVCKYMYMYIHGIMQMPMHANAPFYILWSYILKKQWWYPVNISRIPPIRVNCKFC